eukprot:TRINITY_DN16563_c2_g1_i1.p1 TRINITY_DN16563_c2_g1~~TRINITY_DN16563_c2_g1_i1.p1  ORF type:complete len:315 (+),score=50.09 TRINITY_DN16563_c2_g1_i1:41-946(+)
MAFSLPKRTARTCCMAAALVMAAVTAATAWVGSNPASLRLAASRPFSAAADVRRLPHSFRQVLQQEEMDMIVGGINHRKALEERNRDAPLPWPHETAEIMLDGTSIIKWVMKQKQREDPENYMSSDAWSIWPARLIPAMKALTLHGWGQQRPRSPWQPVITVYDLPDPKTTWSGGQVAKWRHLARHGPKFVQDVGTLAFSQTYVDRSAEMNFRADKEILYMLELITREDPRRQVLVTANTNLVKEARQFATVRSPKWLRSELLKTQHGIEAVETLMGDHSREVRWMARVLPPRISKAFLAG